MANFWDKVPDNKYFKLTEPSGLCKTLDPAVAMQKPPLLIHKGMGVVFSNTTLFKYIDI